jgi:hypothetical protein
MLLTQAGWSTTDISLLSPAGNSRYWELGELLNLLTNSFYNTNNSLPCLCKLLTHTQGDVCDTFACCAPTVNKQNAISGIFKLLLARRKLPTPSSPYQPKICMLHAVPTSPSSILFSEERSYEAPQSVLSPCEGGQTDKTGFINGSRTSTQNLFLLSFSGSAARNSDH